MEAARQVAEKLRRERQAAERLRQEDKALQEQEDADLLKALEMSKQEAERCALCNTYSTKLLCICYWRLACLLTTSMP